MKTNNKTESLRTEIIRQLIFDVTYVLVNNPIVDLRRKWALMKWKKSRALQKEYLESLVNGDRTERDTDYEWSISVDHYDFLRFDDKINSMYRNGEGYDMLDYFLNIN